MSNRQKLNDFVQLGRTFRDLAKHARESDSFDLDKTFFSGPQLSWEDLLKEFRTVVLSEAGTGKTEEIRQTAKRLRAESKRAFFLRLEHIPDDFEDAFEVGTFDEFEQWLSSTDEAWLLLDSVDEARLRNPGDFERAVQKLGRYIQSASARAIRECAGPHHTYRPHERLARQDRSRSLLHAFSNCSRNNASERGRTHEATRFDRRPRS